MAFLKIGETDREGRQKRIEHTGRYLRASRTGGVSLRAQTRVAGVNATANTSHGVRLSTRLAKNTQVALQNGRFVLRGRYGSDGAKINLSKSGVSVSTKTPVGAINWFRPGSSSFKAAGIHVRGQKALYLQAIYGVVAIIVGIIGFVLQALMGLFRLIVGAVGYVVVRYQRARQERERLHLDASEVAGEGRRLIDAQGVDLATESDRDLFAALAYAVLGLGRGEETFDPASVGMPGPDDAAGYAFAVDARVCGEQLRSWLSGPLAEQAPRTVVGLVYVLAATFAERAAPETRAEALLALDDACLATGPKTLLQEEMIDILEPAFGIDIALAGEGGPEAA